MHIHEPVNSFLRAAKGAQKGNFNRNYNQLKLIYTSGDAMKILNGANKA